MAGPKEIKISLLLEDLTKAREISEIFRRMDVIPAIYDNLQDLWFDILRERPTLCIVDIRKITEGDLVLKDHPALKSAQLNVAFFYERSFAPLLVSINEITNWGMISDSASLEVQVKCILDRINKFSELSYKYKASSRDLIKQEQTINKIHLLHQDVSRDLFYKNMSNVWIEKFDLFLSNDNFYDFIEQAFASFDEILKFTILELSQSKQRLICPQIPNVKYVEIPSVWLGKTLENGVDFYGENMASQVFLDLLASSQRMLPIHGSLDGAEVLISIVLNNQSDKNKENDLDLHMCWGEICNYLSSIHRMYQLRNSMTPKMPMMELNNWQFSELISSYYFSHFEVDSIDKLKSKSLISLDFSSLIENATSKAHTKFYWKKFQVDFLNFFSKKVKVNFNYTCSFSKMFFLVPKIDEDHFWTILQSFSLRFSYWKYFDETDAILAKNMKPEMKSLLISPLSLKNEFLGRNGVNTRSSVIKSQIREFSPELTM